MIDDLPLFRWQPPRQIIPFPALQRGGHANIVALQLKKARTIKDANRSLSRALDKFIRQMEKVGIPAHEIDRQRFDYLRAITTQCQRVGAEWCPDLPDRDKSDRGGMV